MSFIEAEDFLNSKQSNAAHSSFVFEWITNRLSFTLIISLICFLQPTVFAREIDSAHYKPTAIVLSISSGGTTCGSSNGSILVDASGGTAPYVYSLNGNAPQSNGNFFFLSAGSYSILVTDALGQTMTDNVTLANTFAQPNVNVAQITQPTGCATKDASLTLTASGGTAPYTYSIDHTNFQAGNVFTNLSAGSYYCAVKDANGCASSYIWYNTTNIPENCPIKQNGQNRSYECYPYKSHLGLYTITGGIPPYQFSLDGINFQTDYVFYPLPAGLYTVTVKDAAGTIMLYSVALHDVCSSSLSIDVQIKNANCGLNGSITVYPIEGTGPYLYSIDDGNFQTNSSFEGLAPGDYTITVKDANDQFGWKLVKVEGNCLTTTTIVTNTTCGFSNGSIEVQPSGGTAPYEYSLDGVQYATNNKFNQLTAQDYTVYIKDASGTVNTKNVTLTNKPGPVLSSVDVTAADCINNTGTATINFQGGAAPFQYVLNAVNFQSTPVFTSLAAGSYKFSVYDANGCFDSYTATIPVNNSITANAGNDLTVCEGTSISIAASSNGNSFSWSPASGLNNPSILKPVFSVNTTTTYILTASLGSCAAKDTITIKVTPAPIAIAGRDTTICPEQSLTLNGMGGITYSWSPSSYLSDASSSNPVMSGAPKGAYTYSLHVKDNNGCSSIIPSTVKVSVIAPVIDAGRDTVVLSNTAVQLQAHDPGNYGFVQFSWSPITGINNPGVANPIVTIDRNVIYTLTAQTQNGCTATNDVSIKVYNGVDIYVPTAFTPNNDGRNDILKAIPVGIKEFKYLSVYNRWGQLVFQTKNASKGWDGKFNGLLQTGVFVWIAGGIDYNGNLVKQKGTTILIP